MKKAIFSKWVLPIAALSFSLTTVSTISQANEKEIVHPSFQTVHSTTLPGVITPNFSSTEPVKKRQASANKNNIGHFTDIDSLMNAIIQQMRETKTSMTFSYKLKEKDFGENFYTYLDKELNKRENHYLQGSYQSTSTSYSSTKFSLNLEYFATAEQEKYVTRSVKNIAASLVKSGMTDFEKVKAVNDYVVNHTVYSEDTKTSPHHIYTYLKEGKAVCQAYALLTYRLLTEMGIEVQYVTGQANGDEHAWNSVKLNGDWFHLDTTWNDPLSENGISSNNTNYKYFLVTSETLEKDHTWSQKDFPVASNNMYSELHKLDSIISYGGNTYFIDEDTESFYKVNFQTQKKELVLATRVFYPVFHSGIMYFSDYSKGGYLTSYNLQTTELKVLATSEVKDLKINEHTLISTLDGVKKTYPLLTVANLNVQHTKKAIQNLSAKSSTYLEDIQKVRQMYEALTPTEQAEIDNYSSLEAIQFDSMTAQKISAKIAELTNPTIDQLIDLREAYDELTTEEKSTIKNLNVFEALEKPFTNVIQAIYAIDAIVPTDSNFIHQVATAKAAYKKDGTQQNLITNASYFLNVEQTANVMTKITALKETSKTYISDVTKAKAAFDKLSSMQKKWVTNSSKLSTALKVIKPSQKVVKTINALNGRSSAKVKAARKAYNKLTKAQKNYVTNYKKLTTYEKKLK